MSHFWVDILLYLLENWYFQIAESTIGQTACVKCAVYAFLRLTDKDENIIHPVV